MSRLIANGFELKLEGAECVLRPYGTATEIRAHPRMVESLQLAQKPLGIDEASLVMGVNADVIDVLCKNCLLVPEELQPILSEDFTPRSSAGEMYHFLWGRAHRRFALIGVACDFVCGSDAHRDTGARQLMASCERNLEPFLKAASADDYFFDYEYKRIYSLKDQAVCVLGMLHHSPEKDTRASTTARLHSMARTAAHAKIGLVTIAGDHSVTYELANAMTLVHGAIQLVHFDAHCDQYFSPHGYDELNHANVIAKILCDLPVAKSVHIGLREGHTIPTSVTIQESERMAVFSPKEVGQLDSTTILASLDPNLPTYLSFDADVLDPAIAPETGHPVPGGITYLQAADLIDEISRSMRVVGADFVEVAAAKTGPNRAATTVSALARRLILGAYSFRSSPMNLEMKSSNASR